MINTASDGKVWRHKEATRTATKSSDSDDARVEREAASGRAWEMRCQALLGARPRFTLWKPRVFRLAPLRPGTALCARMKDADREHKDNVPNALLDGVAAGGQCQTQTISARAGRGGLCLVSRPSCTLFSLFRS